METQNKKAVIYCRVSTKEQVDEGGSLATQEKICKEYALKNGYDIAAVFIEQGESAKNVDRTELAKLMAYCCDKANGIKAVIAYKVDRIARNIDDYRQIRITLKLKDVEIKSTSEYFEDTPAGRFMENIIANVAQFDNDVRTERCIGGMRDAIREGRYVWMAPIGYSNVKIGGRANISPNEKADFIRQTFEEVAKNMRSIEEIRRDMTKAGLVGKRGNPVSKAYFYEVLTNRLYTGWINILGERHKGLFEPIISEELYQQVQMVLKHRKRRIYPYQVENPDFPLRRFTLHPSGRKLTGCWSQGRSRKYPYYYFLGQKSAVRKELLENEFMAFLDNYCLTQKQCDVLAKKITEHLLKATEDTRKEKAQLEKFIADLKDRQSGLIQKNLQGIISDFLLKDQLEMIDRELMNTYSALQRLPQVQADLNAAIPVALEYLHSPGKVWEKAPLNCKVKLQWFEFPQGVILDGQKFRTAEICRLFKDKNSFLPLKSAVVDYPILSSNHITKKPLLPTGSVVENSKSENESDLLYWQRIGDEIIQLAEILKEI